MSTYRFAPLPFLALLQFTSAVLQFASAVPAQWVWPPAFATVRGNAVMNAPFTVNPGHATTTTRVMIVIDATALPFPVGTVINRLSLRRDGSYSAQSYSATAGVVKVRMGPAIAPPDRLDDVCFDRVFDGLSTVGFHNSPATPFAIPAANPPAGSAAAPFDVVIPFNVTYTWTGGPLAIEIVWTPASSTSLWRVDAVALPRPHGLSRTVAGGCTGSNGFEPTHFVHPETTNPGATLITQLEGTRRPTVPIEAIALHLLGLQDTGPSLPFPLTAIGGVPGCYLRVDPLLTTSVSLSNPSLLFGRARSSVALPPAPGLVGTVLYSQWLCFDTAFATPLPLTASDVQAIILGPVAVPPAPRLVRTIWKYGSAGSGSEMGRMVPDDYGPILRFN